MEKLFFSKLTLVLFVFASFKAQSQDSYVIFKIVGKPILNSSKQLTKGSILKSNDTITLQGKDSVLIIDDSGELYEVPDSTPNKNEYAMLEINKYKTSKEVTSFSKKYLSYVWKQFSKKDSTGEHIGVVYRSNLDSIMLKPFDSVKLYLPEVKFSWRPNNTDQPIYFLLKEKGNDFIHKIGVNGNGLVLFVDKKVLVPGKEYLWSISNEKYPNLNNIDFYYFSLLDKNSFENKKSELTNLISDLELLGLSQTEIKDILCKDYKLCY
jgi:hypothetical protein